VYYLVFDSILQPATQSSSVANAGSASHSAKGTTKPAANKPASRGVENKGAGNKSAPPAGKAPAKSSAPLIIALVCGALSAAYSAVAFGKRAYTIGVFSILGYLLDVTWSLLNTMAGFLVWAPACLIIGANSLDSTSDSQRSGTLVFDKNPRGPTWVTTIGTVIAGKWCSHEETHVWQARIFGPAYLLLYGVSLLLNMLFRLITGHVAAIGDEAYYRVCFEDWAYTAGSTSGSDINWGMWFLWFSLSAVYAALFALLAAGIATNMTLLLIVGSVGVVAYCLIRAFTPRNA
jgi:hypothetical protein